MIYLYLFRLLAPLLQVLVGVALVVTVLLALGVDLQGLLVDPVVDWFVARVSDSAPW